MHTSFGYHNAWVHEIPGSQGDNETVEQRGRHLEVELSQSFVHSDAAD